jgi:hypothetical protein
MTSLLQENPITIVNIAILYLDFTFIKCYNYSISYSWEGIPFLQILIKGDIL